jgi:hypothetical protein
VSKLIPFSKRDSGDSKQIYASSHQLLKAPFNINLNPVCQDDTDNKNKVHNFTE